MLDFDEIIDPMARLRRLQAQALQPQQPAAKITPLSEEEERGVLPRIAGATLGGPGYVGGVLEKTFGGRAVRGLPGGKPRELLSVLPFSDTLGVTDEADRVSGRDLLRNMGAADREDTRGNFPGGLGAEVALDPATYLTFGAGALTRSGQVARKIGQLPGTARGRLTGSLADILQANPTLQGAAETAAGGADKLKPLLNESLPSLNPERGTPSLFPGPIQGWEKSRGGHVNHGGGPSGGQGPGQPHLCHPSRRDRASRHAAAPPLLAPHPHHASNCTHSPPVAGRAMCGRGGAA